MTLIELGLEAYADNDKEHLVTISRHLNKEEKYKLVSMIRQYELLQLPYEMRKAKIDLWDRQLGFPINLSTKEREFVESFL